jgi:hypothetical protein
VSFAARRDEEFHGHGHGLGGTSAVSTARTRTPVFSGEAASALSRIRA